MPQRKIGKIDKQYVFFGMLGKKLGHFSRQIAKTTGGAIDPMGAVRHMLSNQMISKITGGMSATDGLIRNVQGQDYIGAAQNIHNYAQKNYQPYSELAGGVRNFLA